MIRRRIFAATTALAALALAAPPLAAQDTASEAPAMMADMFGKAEPLTPEQEARIPAAEQVVARIFPPGTYARMMNDTMKPMMDNVMGSFMDVPLAEIAKLSGLPAEEFVPKGLLNAYNERQKSRAGTAAANTGGAE